MVAVGLERRERRMAEEAIMKGKNRKDRTYEPVCTENLGRKTELMRVSERARGLEYRPRWSELARARSG